MNYPNLLSVPLGKCVVKFGSVRRRAGTEEDFERSGSGDCGSDQESEVDKRGP